jgi:hypothetical protein
MTGPTLGRGYYRRLRKKYTPQRIKLAIVAESPPSSGKYFYDANGKVGEPLFKALMKHIGFKNSPSTKADGLHRFQQKCWILMDATYEPVNKLSKSRQKAKYIERDYARLRRDLHNLGRPPLILIKKNVCQILEPMLADEGFNVLNRGRVVYFPSHGRQTAFHRQFKQILSKNRALLSGR